MPWTALMVPAAPRPNRSLFDYDQAKVHQYLKHSMTDEWTTTRYEYNLLLRPDIGYELLRELAPYCEAYGKYALGVSLLGTGPPGKDRGRTSGPRREEEQPERWKSSFSCRLWRPADG